MVALSLMKFFMESTAGRNSSAGQQWMAGEWRKQRGKGNERERERERREDFAEECHSWITFMNCCSTLSRGYLGAKLMTS